MQPVIVLVGRPNVGKSTLFNRFTKSRDAIVANYAGLTRDRHYGKGSHKSRNFIVVDTGGFEPHAESGSIYKEMAKQTRQAVAEADVVIFLVDVREGLSAQDHEIANYLRRLGKSYLLAANKAEGISHTGKLADFYELGLGEVHSISAAHGDGIYDLLDHAFNALPPHLDVSEYPKSAELEANQAIRLAVAGRPNVGKSTLINTWLGEERLVAYDLPGTTRDTINIPFTHDSQAYELIDTAGLRRKGKVFEAIEKFSVIKTLQAIENAHVVVLLIDATEGVTEQDTHIAGYILEAGRAVVVAINKWDAVDSYQREQVLRMAQSRLGFLKFAAQLHISAHKRQGIKPLWSAIQEAYAAAYCKMPTPILTRLIHEAVQHQAPKRGSMYRPKLRYAHQGGSNPPIVVVHGNSLEGVTDNYKRYLEGRIRQHFNLVGTPLRVEMKKSRNPYTKN